MSFIPKRRKRPKMGLREKPQWRSQPYRQYVCGFACLIAGKLGHVCGGAMHPHHIREGTDGTQEDQPSDWFTVPLCAIAHDEVHKGHHTFEAKYKLDLLAIAADIWRGSRHKHKYEIERKAEERRETK